MTDKTIVDVLRAIKKSDKKQDSLHDEFKKLRTDVKKDIKGLRTDVKKDIKALKEQTQINCQKLNKLQDDMTEIKKDIQNQK